MIQSSALFPIVLLFGFPIAAAAQDNGRISGRVSVHTDSAQRDVVDVGRQRETMVTTAATFETREGENDANGLEMGLDVRQSRWLAGNRPDRISVYNGFVGTRAGGDTGVRVRAGHMWLPDLGTIGNIAGGLLEVEER